MAGVSPAHSQGHLWANAPAGTAQDVPQAAQHLRTVRT